MQLIRSEHLKSLFLMPDHYSLPLGGRARVREVSQPLTKP
jgi:hypothetical protein